jgi:hypothetical protein
MIDFVLHFGTLPLGDLAAVLEYSTLSYSVIPGCPKWDQIDAYRNAYLGIVEGDACYSAFEAAANSNIPVVQSLLKTYSRYNCSGVDPKLQTTLNQLNSCVASIKHWRSSVHLAPTSTTIPPPNTAMPLDVPTAAFLVQRGPILGIKDSGEFSGPFRIAHTTTIMIV